jgi:signal transduction histidine kinase/AmiR/NasT family two-component response regulator
MTTRTNHRILVIDDNRAIHDDFRKILCPTGGEMDQLEAAFFSGPEPVSAQPVFEIDSAYQGEEGVAALRRATDQGRPYAMAFVDVRMPPGMDGVETAERLWQLCPELQVVICTAHSDYSWQEMIHRLGNRDRLLVLKKPFAAIEALQLACALCEKWKLTQEARDHLADTERVVEERTHQLRETNERLQAEMEQRQKAEAHLLRAQRLESIGTLASGIAHDLNNMLSPILMSADLLRMNLPEESQQLVSTIENSAQRAAGVVRQVLTFARGVEGERVLLQPRQLLREIVNVASETFPRNIRIECDLPKDLGCLRGDVTQLHQVLMNLCVNARDAMPDGGTLRIEAGIVDLDGQYASMRPDAHAGRYFTMRVSDTGTGIPQEILSKIFDPFFTTKALGNGTGLGLSTAIGIVKSHDGFLDVRSQLGKGTTFEIFLPVASENVSSTPIEKDAPLPAGHGEWILVLDDESDVRTMTAAVLTQYGYHVRTAADGAEAVSIYAQHGGDIRVVLTDIMMPVVDGVALCRALRKMNPEVCVLVATGYADESRALELRSLNVREVLRKPFSTATLLTALDGALASHRTTSSRLERRCA